MRIPMLVVAVAVATGCAVSDDAAVSSTEQALTSATGGDMPIAHEEQCPEIADIDALIAKLGDPRYAVREAAQQQLAAMCGRYQCQMRVMAKLATALGNADAEIAARATALRYACAGGCTDNQPPNHAKVNCTYSSNAHTYTVQSFKCEERDATCFGYLTITQTCGEPTLQTAPYPGQNDDANPLITCPDGVQRRLVSNIGASVYVGLRDVLTGLCPNTPRPEHADSIGRQLVASTTFQGDLEEGMCVPGPAPKGCANAAVAQQQVEQQLQAKINSGNQWCRATSAQIDGYICAGGDALDRSCPLPPPGGGGGGGGPGPGDGSGSGSGPVI